MNDGQLVERASLPVSDTDSLLQAITQAAANPAVDVGKMERLFAMHKELIDRENEGLFNAALALVQKRIQPVAAKAYNHHTKSHYAKLSAITDEVVPLYSAEGFSVSFNTEAHPDKGWIRTVAILAHRRGHSRRYELDMPLDDKGLKDGANKTGVQATGSSISYSRRYLLCMIFNVSTMDDKDGNREAAGKPEVDEQDPGRLKLEAAGSEGALKAAWSALTPDDRARLGDVMTQCRKRIRQAEEEAGRG